MTHPGQVTITRPWFWSGDAQCLWQSGLMFSDLWAGPVWPGNEVNNKCGSQSACIHIISPRWFIVSALHFLYVITDNDSQCWVSAWPASHHLPGPEFLNHKMRPATLRALSQSPVVFRCLWSNLHPDVNPGAPPLVCCDVCDPRCIHGVSPHWSPPPSVASSVDTRRVNSRAMLLLPTVSASNEISGLMTNYMFYVRGDKKFNVYQHRLQQLVLS